MWLQVTIWKKKIKNTHVYSLLQPTGHQISREGACVLCFVPNACNGKTPECWTMSLRRAASERSSDKLSEKGIAELHPRATESEALGSSSIICASQVLHVFCFALFFLFSFLSSSFLSKDRTGLCSSGWPPTCGPASASWMQASL